MQAATAQDFSITTGATARPATAYIFYPLNMIAPALKASVPDWKAGGLLRSELATLRHRNGYIRQCEITECRQHMVAQRSTLVMPGERRHMPSSYMLTEDGVTRQIQSDDPSNPLLFTPWYPDQELGQVLGQNDGLVRMPLENAREMIAAQYFLFPDWDEYLAGRKVLPTKLATIREMLNTRLQAATDPKMRAVAEAAIRACDLADSFGRAHVNRENAMYAEAQARGWAWSYGVDSELFMDQLGLSRRDNLAQEQANKIDRLADVLTEAFARQALAPPAAVVPAAPVAEVPVIPVSPELPPPAVGDIVRFGDKVGQITAINKSVITIETPSGEVLKAKPAEVEVATA